MKHYILLLSLLFTTKIAIASGKDLTSACNELGVTELSVSDKYTKRPEFKNIATGNTHESLHDRVKLYVNKVDKTVNNLINTKETEYKIKTKVFTNKLYISVRKNGKWKEDSYSQKELCKTELLSVAAR